MKKYRRLPFLLLTALIAIALVVLSVSLSNSALKKGQEERAQKNILADIISKTNNQNPIINDDLKGKTIVINVWATWCKPCLHEIPELNELVEDYKGEDVVFIALNRDDKEEEMKKMEEKEIQFDYDLYFDQSELINLLYSYKLEKEGTAIPLNVVINKQGQPAFYYMGNQPDKLEEVRIYLSKLDKMTVNVL